MLCFCDEKYFITHSKENAISVAQGRQIYQIPNGCYVVKKPHVTKPKIGKKGMKAIGAENIEDVGVGYAVVDTSGKATKVYFSKSQFKWAKSVDTNLKVWTPTQEHEYPERGDRKHGSKESWASARSIKVIDA